MRGTCENFCPESEIKLRTSEKLLNFYEYKNGQKHVPGVLIKCFSRSAAGTKTPTPKELRTEHCLQQTVAYLLKDIVLDKRRPYNFAYDFIFDRLRAVRQEIVIQNYNARQTLRLVEPMIMFLAYSRYRLCTESLDNFDPKICEQHLQECLKRALCCYDEINENSPRIDAEIATNLNELKNRSFIEALYQIFNLGSIEALKRGLAVNKTTKEQDIFRMAYSIAVNNYRGNIYRVLNEIPKLPHILCALAALKMQQHRRKLLLIFAHAYHSKQLTVPLEFICRLTKHTDYAHLRNDLNYFKLQLTADKNSVQFSKTDFNLNAELQKERHEDFANEKLAKIYLPEVLLLRKL